jgi:predicted acylesterase/phospholipase RssA
MVLQSRLVWTTTLAALLVLAGCASRPINPPMTQVDPNGGYTFQTRQKHFKSRDTLVVLAFSGGGTRAAAFSYGALEFLRRTEVAAPDGTKLRLLDAVDMITGVSGGSFTALAYGLYGDKLFADYEQRFLKRNVQGELLSRAASPGHWADYIGGTAGRSELAANYYDEILFNGATFGDLDRGDGPYIVASATDISTGSRIPFSQSVFNLMCTDLNAIRLARAASASSAVPVVLSTVTLNNYGGTCNADVPAWVKMFTQSDNPPRPAARAIRELNEGQALADGVNRPYIHLVDGGISDNVGMRGVLDALQLLEALHAAGVPTPLDHVKRIVVLVVNSLSSPPHQLGPIGKGARHGGRAVEIQWRADRPLFLRGGRAAEGHFRALGHGAPSPGPGWVREREGFAGLHRHSRAAGEGLRHRRVVSGTEGPDRAGLSERPAHQLCLAGRGGGPPACRSGHDHRRVARIPAAVEGRRRESRQPAGGSRCRAGRRPVKGPGAAAGVRGAGAEPKDWMAGKGGSESQNASVNMHDNS